MSTNSYTLADGTTATVTATENGVPFNEGMQALTKAIKARVAARDGGSGTGGASGTFKIISGPSSYRVTCSNQNITFTFEYTGDLSYFLVSRAGALEYVPVASSSPISIYQNYPYGFTFTKTSNTTWVVTLDYHGDQETRSRNVINYIVDVEADSLDTFFVDKTGLFMNIMIDDY